MYKVGKWLPTDMRKSNVQKRPPFCRENRTYHGIHNKILNKIIYILKKHIFLYTIIDKVTINVYRISKFDIQNNKIKVGIDEQD